ncbi:MAG: AGE family epimerase/isomerase [Bifidobacteriaceae bacterium]|jgi:mannose/cellobiose epimerase-like protein (N-acyl-D-glucosamine 2-epimerase family)|nr:AGE family epimerase/isomerase [Bifidobacteriaceae bacterium]
MRGSDWRQHVEWLNQESVRLLEFGRAASQAPSGFAWLDAAGRPQLDAPLDLWITCRMTHVYALGALMGHAWCAPLAQHGVDALLGPFADQDHGGWYSQIAPDGAPTDPTKAAYAHAFVILGAASAAVAGLPGAPEVLKRALTSQNVHFREAGEGLVVDLFNRDFTGSEDYRGVNANMHTVEAYLAAADVTGDSRWRSRALAIAEWVVGEAADLDWRIPEHFTKDWQPLLDYNQDNPEDQFRPYGATPGHGFEWSRLILELRAALGQAAPLWMKPAAEELFRRAYLDGWRDSPTPGFVYTTDWDGRPVIRARLHWVAAEAVGAAVTAYRATGDPLYHHLYSRWWDMIAQRFIDTEAGSWHHEVSEQGAVQGQVWEGKPDLYHALQATLIPRLPLAPTLATALRQGLLDKVPAI